MRLKTSLTIATTCLGLLAACHSQAQHTDLSVTDFEKSIAQINIQVLDVRTLEEYQSGHLKNALLADWNNREEFDKRINALDKDKPVYAYCLSGFRSAAAAQYLKQKGFSAYNLSGGIIAWKKADKPFEQAPAARQISLPEYLAQIPAGKTVLVEFGAAWCPPCKKMTPLIDSLEKTNGHQFVLVKIDGASQTGICRELKVNSFPTFIIYKQGKEIWRKEGLVEAKEFKEQF